MPRFQSILAQIDTSRTLNSVLDAAVVMADRHAARLTLVDVVPEFAWPARLALPDADRIRGQLAEQKKRRLTELAEPLISRGLDVQTRVLLGRTSTRLIEEVRENGHDLVMRLTKGVHSRRGGFLGTTGLQLLRHCPCPVWLIKPEQPPKVARIVAAVDVGATDDAHRQLNERILAYAKSVAEAQQCPLSVIFVWTIYGENVLREHMKPEEFEELERASAADHQVAMDRLLAACDLALSPDDVHLLRGDAITEIPKFVEQHRVDLLVMGTIARRGVAGWFLGNTAELVFDRANCALLAVKPGEDSK